MKYLKLLWEIHEIKNIFERSLAYTSGILYNSYNEGDEYSNSKKTIIWILDYVLPGGSDNYHEIFKYKNENATREIDSFEQHFIQLPLFIERVTEIKTEEEKWLAYFSGQLNEKEKEELYQMARSIEEINEIVEAVMTDPDVRYALDVRMRKRIDEVLARNEGREESKEEIAKKLLTMGLSIEKIIEATGLSKEVIVKLK